jgi:hypothetical protein
LNQGRSLSAFVEQLRAMEPEQCYQQHRTCTTRAALRAAFDLARFRHTAARRSYGTTMARSGLAGKLSWKRLVVALVLAVPVSLAGLIRVGMLGHGNRGVFLALAWLLAPLPTIADRLNFSNDLGLVVVLLQGSSGRCSSSAASSVRCDPAWQPHDTHVTA